MVLDILFLCMLLLAIYKGAKNGLVVAIFSLIGWILGLWAAVKFSGTASEYLKDVINVNERWLALISFAIVFLIVTLLVRIGAAIIQKTMEFAMLGWVNRLGGIIFYVLLYMLIFSVIIYFAEKVRLINEDIISSSIVYDKLGPIIFTLKRLL